MCSVCHLDAALSKHELWIDLYVQMMHELVGS